MNKILTICPSRGRPYPMAKMYGSFQRTSKNSDLIVYLDDDDLVLNMYREIPFDCEVKIQPRHTITELFNQALKDHPDYDFYHLTNDDVIYRTDGWDELFIERLNFKGGGIVYGNDYLSFGGNCPHPCVSGGIARSIGWLQLPGITHLYGDAVWKALGQKISRLYYMPNVIIEHMTWMNQKSEVDETYKRTNSPEMFKYDNDVFQNWLSNGFNQDAEKARVALGL